LLAALLTVVLRSIRLGQNEKGEPHGMIDIALCTTLKSAELKAQKRHALEVRDCGGEFGEYDRARGAP
jgi:hypothetical protein